MRAFAAASSAIYLQNLSQLWFSSPSFHIRPPRSPHLSLQAVFGGGFADSSSSAVSLSSLSVSSCSAIQSLDSAMLSGGSSYGGGLFLNFTTSVTISRSTVTGCSADSEGGGISLFSIGSGTAIDSSTIDGCTASSQGGGISANVVPSFSLTNSTVSSNQLLATFAPYGAGLYVVDSLCSVEGSVFAGNGAYGSNGPSDGVLGEGGGIYFIGGMTSTVYSVDRCIFRDNQVRGDHRLRCTSCFKVRNLLEGTRGCMRPSGFGT